MRNLLKRRYLLLATVAGLGIAASSAGAGTWVPAVPVKNSQATSVFGINDKNIVTGDYVDASGVTHGFVGPFDGTKYKSFDDSSSGATTQPRAINISSFITGFDTGTLVPWERTPTGTLTTITFSKGHPLNQLAQGINKTGVFAGNFLDKKGISVGYLGKKSMFQSKITLSIKNGGYSGRAINDAGDVTGWYYDTTTGLQHGYVIIGGKAKSVDFPKANYTVMEGLNDKGLASGQYQDSSGVIHGFLYNTVSGKMRRLDAPGATLTQAWGIDNNDVVAVSSSAGSFVYCVRMKSCPGGADAHVPQPPVGKYVPAMP